MIPEMLHVGKRIPRLNLSGSPSSKLLLAAGEEIAVDSRIGLAATVVV